MYRPTDNKFDYLEGSAQLKESVAYLKDYIKQYPPELIITLGEYPLRYMMDLYNVYQWRGSPLEYKGGIKFLPTHDPSDVIISKDLFSILSFDLKKALDYLDGKKKSYNDSVTILTDPTSQRNAFEEILSAEYVTIDIETKRPENDPTLPILCIGFGLSDERAIVMGGNRDSLLQTIRELIPQISRPIYHNGLFDVSILRYFHNVEAPAPFFDTMIAQHVLEPEMPKGLDFLCSTLTWRPCYWAGIKFDEESKSWSDKKGMNELYAYNALDCLVTYESFVTMKEELKSHPSLDIFNYEMDMHEAIFHITSVGFEVDEERRTLLLSTLKEKKEKDYAFLFAFAQEQFLVSSPVQVKKFLYETLALPVKRDRKGSVTSGEGALVELIGTCKMEKDKVKTAESKQKWDIRIACLKLILNIREFDKLISSYVGVPYSNDKRLRGRLKIAGTESGRLAGGTWYDDTGLNTQTLPRTSIEI